MGGKQLFPDKSQVWVDESLWRQKSLELGSKEHQMERCWSSWDSRNLGEGVIILCLSGLQLPGVYILTEEFGGSGFLMFKQTAR